MSFVCGVDGCRGGWLSILRDSDSGVIEAAVYPDASTLVSQQPKPAVLAIDIPIGLPDAESRTCDVEARRVLKKPRSTSVFPAPIRPAVVAANHAEASEITRLVDGRKISVQAWSIIAKIRQIDDVLRPDVAQQSWVREVHPEVSFWAWNANRPMVFRKTTPKGRAERTSLVEAEYGPAAIAQIRNLYAVKHVAHDDILDAFAALWTAERIHRGEANTIPERPHLDSVGLRMEIVY